MWKSTFFNISIFYIASMWFRTFSGAVIPTHVLSQGISLPTMIAGIAIMFLAQVLILIIFKSITARKAFLLSFVTACIFITLVAKINFTWQYYLGYALTGVSSLYFFMIYNIAYYENTPKEKIGKNSALLYNIPTIIGILAPLLAGYLAKNSMNLVWIFSAVFLIPAIYLTIKQKDFSLSYSIAKGLEEIKTTRLLIFLEGVWEAMPFAIIPIYTLFFIKSPLSYGLYLAGLSLIGVVANLALGKLTDKWHQRAVFLYPLTILMAALTFCFAFVDNNIRWWLILTAALQILLPLFWNITTAMVIDTKPNLRVAIPGREFILALGRLMGASLALVSFILEKTPYFIYFILTGVLILFPIVLYWNSKYKNYSYL